MSDQYHCLPLPPLSALTLLRALCQRPASQAQGGPVVARHLLAAVDFAHAARYREAFGSPGTGIPLTYYYLLAQRAHLACMLDAALPFRLAGAIHVDNLLRAGIQPLAGRPLLLATTMQLAAPSATGARHAVLETEATQDGTLVFGCRSTYLVVRGRRGGAARAAAAAPEAMAPVAEWRLSAASGRAYAALSGDWNPIHLWPWSARLLGLKAPIIHGMHTLGRAGAALERAGGRPLALLEGRFRAPITLGSSVALAAALAQGRYTVEAGGRVAVEGSFAFAAAAAAEGAPA